MVTVVTLFFSHVWRVQPFSCFQYLTLEKRCHHCHHCHNIIISYSYVMFEVSPQCHHLSPICGEFACSPLSLIDDVHDVPCVFLEPSEVKRPYAALLWSP